MSDIGPDQVMIGFKAGAICGSDLPKFRWSSEPDRHLQGTPGVPLHEVVGEVVASRSSDLQPGDRVVGMIDGSRGLSEIMINSARKLHKISDQTLSDVQATVTQPLATVLNALAHVHLPQTVAVLGLGPLGLLLGHCAKRAGATTVIGVDQHERGWAGQKFGFDTVLRGDIVEHQDELASRSPDLVIDAIGHHSASLGVAVNAAAAQAEIMMFGIPDPHYDLPAYAFLRKGLRLWSGTTQDWPHYLAAAETLLSNSRLLREHYITDTVSLDNAEAAFQLCIAPAGQQLKVAVTPPRSIP